jgi:hypothetical protein
MRKISPEVLEEVLARPQVCARRFDGGCNGRLTIEHTLTFGAKQIGDAWSLLWLCTYHHAVEEHTNSGGLDKERNVHLALNQATDEELLKYSKAINYVEWRDRLNFKYGNK